MTHVSTSSAVLPARNVLAKCDHWLASIATGFVEERRAVAALQALARIAIKIDEAATVQVGAADAALLWPAAEASRDDTMDALAAACRLHVNAVRLNELYLDAVRNGLPVISINEAKRRLMAGEPSPFEPIAKPALADLTENQRLGLLDLKSGWEVAANPGSWWARSANELVSLGLASVVKRDSSYPMNDYRITASGRALLDSAPRGVELTPERQRQLKRLHGKGFLHTADREAAMDDLVACGLALRVEGTSTTYCYATSEAGERAAKIA